MGRGTLPGLVVFIAGCRIGFEPVVHEPVTGSNGLATPAVATTSDVVIDGDTTFDTDTGAISGAFVRAPGVGIIDGIGYAPHDFQGAQIGAWEVDGLVVIVGGRIRLVGSRSAALLVATNVTIDGAIDGSSVVGQPGAGAGLGAPYTALATGCGPGEAGVNGLGPTNGGDGGGGGGGGGDVGGAGGAGDNGGTVANGGGGGAACIAATIEPLVGGSGGGGAGRGNATAPVGGDGGGALQITANETIAITGTIAMNGAGGEEGHGGSNDEGAGAGGGAGGAILVEAFSVVLGSTAILAANGGGGGGGGGNDLDGVRGADGANGSTPAPGGANTSGQGGAGGQGGSRDAAATGGETSPNGGGGGGASGRIHLCGRATVSPAATISPPQS